MGSGQSGSGSQPDEQALRQAAEAGDLDSAYELGVFLHRNDRDDEAEPFLRRAVHTENGPDAAFCLGLIAAERDRPEEAETWWLLAAHAGESAAAYNLAGLLQARGLADESGRWYRQVAGGSDGSLALDARNRLAARRVDDTARKLIRVEDWPALWALILSLPIADAVRAAKHLQGRQWRPSDPPARALAERLVAEDTDAVVQVVDRAAKLSTRIYPFTMGSGGAGVAEPVTGEPVIALDLQDWSSKPPDALTPDCYLSTLDLAGGRNDISTGPRGHSSIGCFDPETIVAVRSASSDDAAGRTTFHWELVLYDHGREVRLADGPGAPYPRVMTTQQGFVVGLRMASEVIVVDEGPPRLIDMSPAGLRYRTDCLAVDPTRTRLAFADDHIMFVTDARLNELIAQVDQPANVHGTVRDLTFTAADSLVSTGDKGMCRWTVTQGQLRPAVVTETRHTVDDLFAVPPWGVVGGTVMGPNPVFFDADTLEPVAAPRPLIGQQRFTRKIHAVPGGRFVAYSGQFLADDPNYGESYYTATAVHDLHHPLNWVNRPLASLTRTDLQGLTGLLDGRPAAPEHTLAEDERRVLDLVRAAAEAHLGSPRA